ncbi:MAG: hypothetical protein A2725_02740 [Candidatus Magasanikbacteria bacterium RIFCSPHIGHO2_01_FULL_33_34]|uniref:DUF11 domain-containing protein n=1 Tax=Candidatus Magasanikbacteria bacterium RIFCSPHIGHO2_01_FULL_33_34 TaxID=1798671 RepID=A0A1F6LH10_9BACT|nr:MAG: hypothetical protein A2725_02740 [Candidatus Magasanikbacteria bacterium RIFCSPHIGHO2_01_FULL_33_34]OGH66053.1 MAG: hypothetical protein A3B83_00230 [Candidatus Magasanikbacteria bacterium RIFCSPHIGHO2_02_FULL_33_17]OGH75899.1 MAG: hypothetical protein A3A89_00140 [Candidatus Magasanikbacteria bacterium RIFCSPLOWO2_01_FULL_33_34]OGH81676.1 MAG: hypothetical protein A3F93_01935 [Candidatus Magasanikbacteria bacterium RIFCSPLOWO2_12_FULL_34_7]
MKINNFIMSKKNDIKKDDQDLSTEINDHKFIKKEIFSDEKINDKKKLNKKIEKKNNKKNLVSEHEKDIDKKLMEIYENADGSMPDMTHFQKKKRTSFIRSLFVLLFACLFLAGVAWFGFFVLQPKSNFSENGVIVSVSGEDKVEIGEVQRYRVRYRNAQNVNLTNVLLQIRYPEGFVLTDTSRTPSNDAKDEWILGDMEGQDSGYIDIYGKLYGTVGEQQSFRVFLNYMAENFSSEFQKAHSLIIDTAEAPFNLVVEAPDKIVSGSEVELVIFVDNVTAEDLENLAVEIEGNASFSIRNSQPKPDQFVENRWNLVDATENKIVVSGIFDSNLLDKDGNFVVKLIGWKDDNRAVDGYVYDSQEYVVKILETDLVTNLVINGSSSNLTVQPGETLNGTVVIRNAGEIPLKNLVARVIFDAPSFEKKSILNWSEINNPQDADIFGEQLSVEKRRGILTWDKNQILDLRQIDPAEEIIADFSLPIKSAEVDELTDYVGSQIEATLELKYELDGENKTISSAPIVMVINSDVDLEVRDEVVYEGEAEKHSITWILTNSFHELNNIKLEADIYGDIEWHDDELVVGAGEVTYDEQKKKLIWNIESMPTALDILALQFGFTLKSQNPTQTNLTSKVIFEAIDAITGEQILMTGKEILLNAE